MGLVSSFSYFRQRDIRNKELDTYFTNFAGRNIAKQFYLFMDDHTGFPGNAKNIEGKELKHNENKQTAGPATKSNFNFSDKDIEPTNKDERYSEVAVRNRQGKRSSNRNHQSTASNSSPKSS